MSKVEMLNGVENLFVSEEGSVRGDRKSVV